MSDVLALQNEVVAAIARQLGTGSLTVGSLVVDTSVTGVSGSVCFGDSSAAGRFRSCMPLESEPALGG